MENDNSNNPVTQREFNEAMGFIKNSFDRADGHANNLENRFDNLETRFDNLENRFDNLENRFDNLETEVHSLRNVAEATLSVVQSIEGRLKEMGDHEERISNLEQTVYRVR